MTHVVAALGSAGDIHPFLAVARALQERGESVLMLANEPHRGEITAQGVPFEAIVSAHQHQRVMTHPHLWHPVHGFGMLWRYFSIASIEPVVNILERLVRDGTQPIKVLAPPQVLGARLAREAMPIHLTTAITAPTGLRTCSDPMFLGPWRVPPWTPRLLRQGLWKALDATKLQPLALPAIQRWLSHRGRLQPEGPIFAKWIHSPDQVISMFPAEFCAPQADWPVRVQMTGFPLYETLGPMDEELMEFTCPHDLPLHVFFPGSASGGRHRVMEAAAADLATDGQHRCLWIGAPFDFKNDRLIQRTWVNLPQVLSSANTFIHHGGIGSCAQGMAHKVRQIVLPQAYDQFENGARIEGSFAGQSLLPRDQTQTSVTTAIRQAQSMPKLTPLPWCTSRPGRPNNAVTAICDAICDATK